MLIKYLQNIDQIDRTVYTISNASAMWFENYYQDPAYKAMGSLAVVKAKVYRVEKLDTPDPVLYVYQEAILADLSDPEKTYCMPLETRYADDSGYCNVQKIRIVADKDEYYTSFHEAQLALIGIKEARDHSFAMAAKFNPLHYQKALQERVDEIVERLCKWGYKVAVEVPLTIMHNSAGEPPYGGRVDYSAVLKVSGKRMTKERSDALDRDFYGISIDSHFNTVTLDHDVSPRDESLWKYCDD